MPEPPVFAVMRTFRTSLLKRERAAATRLVNAYGETYQRLLPLIEALIVELEATPDKVWKVHRLTRLKQLKKQIEREVGEFAIYAEREIHVGAREAINAGAREARVMAQASLPGLSPLDARIMSTWNRLPVESVETLLGFFADGSPLRENLAQLGADVANVVEKRLTESIALGYSPRKIAPLIRNELGQGLTWSLRTARTAQIYSYREAQRANYIANDHVVKGWIWRCARGARTCMSCINMDGRSFPLSARLNDHQNGRCFQEPQTFTYRELGIDVDEPPKVADTAKDWFRKQPEGVQRQMMGKSGFDFWKQGKFDLDQYTTVGIDQTWGDVRSQASLKDILGANWRKEQKAA
jgi:hypothetical protein